VYVDTSVFGGYFDTLYEKESRRFLLQVQSGRIAIVTSGLVAFEVARAPTDVQALYASLAGVLEMVDAENAESLLLAQAYLAHGILTPKWLDDALHVAYATVTQCDMIVSWNFRHIVNFRKIPRYNAVNALQGYGSIAIYSPQEITGDEEEDI
jgi:predicted nucleic acid-binding protein